MKPLTKIVGMLPKECRVSIITVCLNNKEGLLRTIHSVQQQQGVAIEHIIVDGGSTDGSLEVIRSQAHNMAKWISEPDAGPYDGMNKGIDLATGDWMHFLNAGDVFSGKDSLARLRDILNRNEVAAVYTDSMADYGDFKIYRKALPYKEIWRGMVFSHQALLIRSEILRQCRFDTKLPKIADYELVLRCLHDTRVVIYVPFSLVTCDAFGISNRGQARILRDYYHQATRYLKLGPGKKLWYFFRYVFLLIIDLVKRVLPGSIYHGMVRKLRTVERRDG